MNSTWIKLNGESGSGKSTLAKSVAFQLNQIDTKFDAYVSEILVKNTVKINHILELNQNKSATYLSNKIQANSCFVTPEQTYEKLKKKLVIGGYSSTLSEGESQRFKLFEAILTSPGLLIMDECLSGLPEEYEKEILLFMKENYLWMNCLYISHRSNEQIDKLFDVLINLDPIKK